MKVIIIAGIRRSGNHALRTWLEHQIQPPCLYRNDCDYKLVSKAQYPVRLYNGSETETNIQPDKFHKYKIYFAGVENPDMNKRKENLSLLNAEAAKLSILTKTETTYKILYIIRNPYNMLASMWAFTGDKGRWRNLPEFINHQANLWAPIAKEFLRTSSPSKNEMIVNYDKWFTDINYRKVISGFCGLQFSDKGKEKITSVGSSFDAHKLNNKASHMKVLERWKKFANDDKFVEWVKSINGLYEHAKEIYKVPEIFIPDS